MRFEELSLSKELLKAIEDMGFEEASPIQVLAIPEIMAGGDVIGQAQTGTGKTAAFGIPILERLDPQLKAIQAIVLCPTRELAIQVAEEIGRLAAKQRGVTVLPVYGGQPIDRQIRVLQRGAHVVVGTPGRMIDHLQRGTMVLSNATTVVLDEADEMLDMGFLEDIENILERMPEDCQGIFFSATMPKQIMTLANDFLVNPKILKITQKELTVANIEQFSFEVRPFQKLEALCRVIDVNNPQKSMVFCSTKRGVDELTAHLGARGYMADGLHGNLSQVQRDRVMARFRTGAIEILVATDVAARGLDVEDVEAVINYDMPHDVESYVHRIGRTGRAGRMGKAFTFVTPRESWKLRDVIRFTKAQITPSRLPTLNDVASSKTAKLLDKVKLTLATGGLDRFATIAESFLEENADQSSMDMAAALLKLLMQREGGSALNPDADSPDALAHSGFSRDRNDRGRPRDRNDRGDRGGDRKFRDRGGDRDERPRRAPRERGARQPRPGDENMVRMFVNVGHNMRVAPRDIVGAIAGESGIPGRSIGAIEIFDKHSFVDIPRDMADKVLSSMNGRQIRGYTVSMNTAT